MFITFWIPYFTSRKNFLASMRNIIPISKMPKKMNAPPTVLACGASTGVSRLVRFIRTGSLLSIACCSQKFIPQAVGIGRSGRGDFLFPFFFAVVAVTRGVDSSDLVDWFGRNKNRILARRRCLDFENRNKWRRGGSINEGIGWKTVRDESSGFEWIGCHDHCWQRCVRRWNINFNLVYHAAINNSVKVTQ